MLHFFLLFLLLCPHVRVLRAGETTTPESHALTVHEHTAESLCDLISAHRPSYMGQNLESRSARTDAE